MIAFIYFSTDFLEITSVTDSGWCQWPRPASPCARGTLGMAKWKRSWWHRYFWAVTASTALSHCSRATSKECPPSTSARAKALPLPPALPAVWQSSRRDSQSIQELSPAEALICQAYPCSVALQLKAFLVFGSLDIRKTWRKMQAEFTAELGRGKKGTYEVPREDGNSKWKIKRKDEAGPLVWLCPLTAPVPPWGAACCDIQWHGTFPGCENSEPSRQDSPTFAQLLPLTSGQGCQCWNVSVWRDTCTFPGAGVATQGRYNCNKSLGFVLACGCVESSFPTDPHAWMCNLWTRLQGQSLLEKFRWIYRLIPKGQNKTISCWFRPLYYFKEQPDHCNETGF